MPDTPLMLDLDKIEQNLPSLSSSPTSSRPPSPGPANTVLRFTPPSKIPPPRPTHYLPTYPEPIPHQQLYIHTAYALSNMLYPLSIKKTKKLLQDISTENYLEILRDTTTLTSFSTLSSEKKHLLYLKIYPYLLPLVRTTTDLQTVLLFMPIETRPHFCHALRSIMGSILNSLDDFLLILPLLKVKDYTLFFINTSIKEKFISHLKTLQDIQKIQQALSTDQYCSIHRKIRQHIPTLIHTLKDIIYISFLLKPLEYCHLLCCLKMRLDILIPTFKDLYTIIKNIEKENCSIFCLSMPKTLLQLLANKRELAYFVSSLPREKRIIFTKGILECHTCFLYKQPILCTIISILSIEEFLTLFKHIPHLLPIYLPIPKDYEHFLNTIAPQKRSIIHHFISQYFLGLKKNIESPITLEKQPEPAPTYLPLFPLIADAVEQKPVEKEQNADDEAWRLFLQPDIR